ncbi:2-dehydropantoate 2-reductase [Roseibacterium elongatum DSM 19469]|uniref:2-dehydropantoate 2-reductase n=1 Tax=Roseicyclus elongatus DSM 19469 TaxID=1294273 RepID=W8RRP3_9RHOB|nr:2-dehydropantoate 2-reductase N-terminal domain-containing protein [Roseibacterium elongatum]AHM03768.1 2-dehydropantoate 2-reductase [Roseibacterium elongatum DSM 19469]
MRIIIYGMGAVGGVVAAALARSGQSVIGIARGAMAQAVAARGLRLRAPGLDAWVPVPVVCHPSEIDWRDDDLILLCMKSQDTQAALEDLRSAGVTRQALFCAQNGVANESAALRLFPNVHGVTVMMPALYLVPGEVAVFTEPKFGIFDLGRYPGGVDADDRRMATALEAAMIATNLLPDVMASKRGKLLLNLGNILKAALGHQAETGTLGQRVRAEAEAVFRAAGLDWQPPEETDAQRDALMRPVDSLPGVARVGGSTNQSLLRGAIRLETDYLNGEIALLGRLHGLDTPLNAGLCRVAAHLAVKRLRPGDMTLPEVEAMLAMDQTEPI